jgi:two-component system, NtrC family, C4-dicarboxylate transport sensor histidine kinase DctB
VKNFGPDTKRRSGADVASAPLQLSPGPAARNLLHLSSTVQRLRLRRIFAGTLVCVAFATIVWQAGEWGRHAAFAELHGAAAASLGLHTAALRSNLEKYRSVAFVLARDNAVAALLNGPSDPGAPHRADRELEALAVGTRAAAIYIVDRAGMAVAASNWRLTTSFVGQDYAFRTYVRAALAEGVGEQFSSGTVSQRAGYYLARRIETKSGPAGVVVVKVEFDELEREWQHSGGHVLATDANGVVLLSDEPEWRFSTLQALPEAIRNELRDEMQYGASAPLTPLPVVQRSGVGPAGNIVRLQAPGMSGVEASFLEVAASVPETGWQLRRLEPLQPAVGRARRSAMMIAFVVAATITLSVLLLLHRRRRARRLFEEKDRQRAELERRVAERTGELSQINALLRSEVEERRRAETDLRQAQDDLVHAAKLATLGQTAASIAHEVNQPLAAMRTYSDNATVLLARGRTTEVKANLASISSLTERIAQITQNLKAFARKASGVLGPVPLQTSIVTAIALLEHRIRQQSIQIATDLPKAEIRVWAEQVRLEQVLVNLLQNALDALKGTVNPEVDITVRATSDRVHITVGDNGPGVRAEDVQRAFSAFFTTKHDGLGLGLSISQGIVHDFGGTLTYVARLETGAVFAIDLRRAP